MTFRLLSRLRRPRAALAAVSVLLVTATVLVLAGCGALGWPTRVDTVGKVSFSHALQIPPLATSRTGAAGEKVFDLTANAGTTPLTDVAATRTQGFADAHGQHPDNAYLGPTIVANRGDAVRVNVHNRMHEPTTVHWHGMHLPASMDGGPHQPIAPGATRSPHWRIDQQAATLWYHPHPHGETEHQVSAGMAGMVIVHDEAERALNLPRNYGVDDIPVIVQDARFDSNGQLTTSQAGFIGPLGDTLLVNGTVGAYLPVTTDVVRLRLLNASSSRIYDFQFDDKRTFEMIASDGGLLSQAAAMGSIQLVPGERAEILVQMSAGENATLRSTPPDLGTEASIDASNGGTDAFDVLQLRAADALKPLGAMPTTLTPITRLARDSATVQRSFDLHGFRINDAKMDMNRIDETITVGTTELWKVRNSSAEPHSFHVHDVQFQVLSVGGAPPPVELSGWKDTIYVTPKTEFQIIMRFTDYTDRNLPYMYHCHMLMHEDHGMMGQFVVVEPGQSAGRPPVMQESRGTGSGPRTQEQNHEH
jgi:FtsP/CotA-like multicopper oxidase with cupredoxin domain